MSDTPQTDTTPSDGGSVKDNLSLRDYFAAKAMQAMDSSEYMKIEHMAADAYDMADAMLKVRAGK